MLSVLSGTHASGASGPASTLDTAVNPGASVAAGPAGVSGSLGNRDDVGAAGSTNGIASTPAFDDDLNHTSSQVGVAVVGGEGGGADISSSVSIVRPTQQVPAGCTEVVRDTVENDVLETGFTQITETMTKYHRSITNTSS